MLSVPVDFLAVAAPAAIMTSHWRGFLCLGLLCVTLLQIGGRYRPRLHLSTLDDIPMLVGRLFLAVAVIATFTALRHPDQAVTDFLRWSMLSAVLLIVGRMLTQLVILSSRRHRLIRHSTVLLGCGPVGLELLRLIDAYPQYGLSVTAIVDDARAGTFVDHSSPICVQPLAKLAAEVARADAKVILIADPAQGDGDLFDLLRPPSAIACDLMVVPRLHDFHSQAGFVDHIGAIPIMRIPSPAVLGASRFVKRAFDLLVATVAFVVIAPVMAVAAIAIRLESPGGALFRQVRITRDGRQFLLLKFRTMRSVDEAQGASEWSNTHGSRVTRVGRVLRKTSIDELPQLWNVLRGDMTIVGPRPERPYFAEKFTTAHPRYAQRHRVMCGLTGLAQVNGLRGDTSISDRARFDNFYIENWSLWVDVKVLIRTVAEVLRGRGS